MDKQTVLKQIKEHDRSLSLQEWISELTLEGQAVLMFQKAVDSLVQSGDLRYSSKKKLILNEKPVIEGILRVNERGFGFVDHEQGSLYIPLRFFNTAMDQDKVRVEPIDSDDLSGEAKVVEVIERFKTQLIGWVEKKKLVLQDAKLLYKVQWNLEGHELIEDQLIVFDIIAYDEPLKLKFNQVLGYKHEPGMDIRLILLEHQIPVDFPEACIEQADQMDEAVLLEAGRVDYRDQLLFTIDGEDARDFDDAVSIESHPEGYQLYVHIADVSHYVEENSALDKEARKRGTSVYLVDRVVPMLPQRLSNDLCSLIEGEDRYTVTAKIVLGYGGEVLSYDLHPSVIRSKKRFTYTTVNQILKGDETLKAEHALFAETLELMQECASRIRYRREEAGALRFERDEAKFIVNEKQKVIDILPRKQDEAEMLIEDFMITANQVVAQHMKWLELPMIYRVHETPDKKRFKDLEKFVLLFGSKLKLRHISPKSIQLVLKHYEDHPAHLVINEMMLRSMMKAVYAHQPLGHFGLALEDYCHFTSPIRRYPDLIVHRMLHRYVFNHQNDKLSFDAVEVETIANECSLTEVRAVEAERDAEDMKMAEYMEDHIGESFKAVIRTVTKFGFFVQLENTVDGLVHISNLKGNYFYDEKQWALIKKGSNQRYQIGQVVQVRVLDANKDKKTIDFVLD